jgi:hypothetical protein
MNELRDVILKTLIGNNKVLEEAFCKINEV